MKVFSTSNIFSTLATVLAFASSTAAQCAMCRASVESTISNGRSNLAEGLNTGILYLLLAPYLCFMVIGYLWYKNSKKQTAQRLALATRLKSILGKK
ncbi:MAG: hypothetical protein KA313_08405 [Pseudarcicella sp.]|nr:hypothetical protein [Pseudarcicella sp.]MBP6411104.1 hypothetical protein [Pseudarcicella sp.]